MPKFNIIRLLTIFTLAWSCFVGAALAQDRDSPLLALTGERGSGDYYCDEAQGVPGCSESLACEAAVCASDSFCCNVSWDGICAGSVQNFPECEIAGPTARATFFVAKLYNDGNPAPVNVTLSCTTGLPLEQTKLLSPAPNVPAPTTTWVEFVVVDFDDGEMDCEVTEEAPTGYAGNYVFFDDLNNNVNDWDYSTDACSFEDVNWGDTALYDPAGGFRHLCWVANQLIPSTVTVYKEWIDPKPEFNNPTYARADWSCSNTPTVLNGFWLVPQARAELPNGLIYPIPYPTSGSLGFYGTLSSNYFQIYGNWNNGTLCSVVEDVPDSGIVSDDSACSNFRIFPGDSFECLITNTRFYEGIPTLSQYGLAILALIMLGMGFVGFRRFV